MATKKIEVNFVNCCLQTRVVNPAEPQPYENFPLANIKSIAAGYVPGIGLTNYPYADQLRVVITWLDGTPEWKYDIQDVDNQAGWTANFAGLQTALDDIAAAYGACVAGGAAAGLATEITLSLIEGYLAPQTLTPVNLTVVGGPAASIPIGTRRGSVLNFGAAAGVWNGDAIPPGLRLPWGVVGDNETYVAIPYDATGTTFIIEYTV
jgi:hypothetical protein